MIPRSNLLETFFSTPSLCLSYISKGLFNFNTNGLRLNPRLLTRTSVTY